MKNNLEYNIAIIGLGYVGLPLAVEFGKKYNVSDNCIRKWIKQYNHIPPKKNGLLVK